MASAASSGGRVSIPVHWAQSRGLWVRVSIPANKVYGTTYGKPVEIRIG
jgi:hypothetical protein